VIAPGLLGPLPSPPDPMRSTPGFDRFLRYASLRHEPVAADGGEESSDNPGLGNLTVNLLSRFGATESAPYARAADDPDWDRTGCVMHADPVHLRADRDRLRLFEASALALSREDTDALIEQVNALLVGDGLRLVAPEPARWYLELPELPRLETQPLERVNGQCIDDFLPTGPDAGRWAALMTELQMLLFQAPANRVRERRGLPAINGLWIAGPGRWRSLAPVGRQQRLYSDLPLARGLAAAAGLEALPAAKAQPEPGALWVVETIAAARLGGEDWHRAVVRLDADLQGALSALRSGALGAIELDLCDGRHWHLSRSGLWRFWRRQSPLASWVSVHPMQG
jgi:hypothetical protein